MIIVYGGSFNPPTLAHYEITKYLINKYKPNKFIFVPVGNKYKKNDLISFHHRYEMLKIIIEEFDNCIISDYENKWDFKGTFDLLNHFRKIYNEEIYFVLGADNLLTIDKWIDFHKLIQLNHFIVFNRNNYDVIKYLNEHIIISKYKDHFIIEDSFKKKNISSSFYRNNNNDKQVLDKVNDYIYINKLYHRGVKNEK